MLLLPKFVFRLERSCDMMKWLTSSSCQYAMCEAIVLIGLKSSTLLRIPWISLSWPTTHHLEEPVAAEDGEAAQGTEIDYRGEQARTSIGRREERKKGTTYS